MVVTDYTRFKGVTNIGDTMLMDELENNMKNYLDWGLLNIGAFINVYRPTTSAVDSGSFHILRPTIDPSYTDGTVWEAIRKDWVWETGINHNGHSPISISGVYINNQLFGTGHATYGHYYDYPNGRVIFNSAVPLASSVSLDYSYRYVQVYAGQSAPNLVEGQSNSFRPGDAQWTSYAPTGGDYSISPQHRIQYPTIIIEAVPQGWNKGFEAGNLSLWVYQDVVFTIIGETKRARNKLIDIFRLEQDHNIFLYDTDAVVSGGFAPLNINGMVTNPSGTYPYLVDNFPFAKCMFKNVNMSSVESVNPSLHEAKVRVTMEMIINTI